jgi:ammonia channel protein AmtB
MVLAVIAALLFLSVCLEKIHLSKAMIATLLFVALFFSDHGRYLINRERRFRS